MKGVTLNLLLEVTAILIANPLMLGFHNGVLNTPVAHIKAFFNATYIERSYSATEDMITLQWSLTSTALFIGCFLGAIGTGFIAKRLGRNKVLIIGYVPQIIGCVLQISCVAAKSPEMLIIGRFLCGMSGGIGYHVSPTLIAEISPVHLRGSFGTCFQLFNVLGILFASILGITHILGTSEHWNYLLALPLLPTSISLVAFLFFPESPRYLMLEKNDEAAARKALTFFVKSDDEISESIVEMEKERLSLKESKKEKTSVITLLKDRSIRLPLLITVVVPCAVQFSGIAGIIFYSAGIYEDAGVAPENIQFAIILQSVVLVFSTALAIPLMDRVGRRPLLLYPTIAMVLCQAVLIASINQQPYHEWLSYVSITLIALFVLFFDIGLGPIPWLLPAELFRQNQRDGALTIFGIAMWISAIVVTATFEYVVAALGEFCFLIYMGFIVIFVIFIFFKLPETKNLTFQEISEVFEGNQLIVRETKKPSKSSNDC